MAIRDAIPSSVFFRALFIGFYRLNCFCDEAVQEPCQHPAQDGAFKSFPKHPPALVPMALSRGRLYHAFTSTRRNPVERSIFPGFYRAKSGIFHHRLSHRWTAMSCGWLSFGCFLRLLKHGSRRRLASQWLSCRAQPVIQINESDFCSFWTNGTAHAAAASMPISFETARYRRHNGH